MPPVVIRYHGANTTIPQQKRGGYELAKLQRISYPDYKRAKIVVDYDSDITEPIRYRQHHHHHHHHHPHKYHHHRRCSICHDYDHHYPTSLYVSPRSEPPPPKYVSPRPRRLEMVMLKPLRSDADTRIAVYNPRHKRCRDCESICSCHPCPEKSTKAIPSMYYDELRCHYCAAHVQPKQDEALAYPWTVQSYKPPRYFPIRERAQSLDLNQPGTLITDQPVLAQKDNLPPADTRSVRELSPLFRPSNDRIPSRPIVNASPVDRPARPSMEVLSFLGREDDVRPKDSVSNVGLPPLRTETVEPVKDTPTPDPKVRAQTEVGSAQPKSADFPTPPFAPITPRPHKKTMSEISRMLSGEYYDRRDGKTYGYNINYSRRHMHSDRQANR